MRDGRFTPIRAISGTQQRPKTGLFEVSTWLIERHGFRPPAAIRNERLQTAALAA